MRKILEADERANRSNRSGIEGYERADPVFDKSKSLFIILRSVAQVNFAVSRYVEVLLSGRPGSLCR